MKISLIQLPISSDQSPSPPLGLFSLFSSIRSTLGLSPIIIDLQLLISDRKLSFDRYFYDKVIRIIEKGRPDVLGIHTLCISHHIAVTIAKLYKKVYPFTKIVLGGPHASATDEITLCTFPFIDLVVRGEAEISFVELIKHISDPRAVKGVTWRDNDGLIHRNPDQPLIKELDDFIYPDQRLDRFYKRYFTKSQTVNLETGRGCTFKCTYCSTSIFWKRASRMRSGIKIFEHMKYFITNFNINRFAFTTDNFALNRKWLLDFASVLYRNRKYKFYWSCASKIDFLSKAVIKELSAVGLNCIFMGIETGSNRMQRTIRKNNKLHMIYPLVKECLRRNIVCKIFFMTGFPNETSVDLNSTLEMMLKLSLMGVKEMFLNLLIPLASTEIASKEKRHLIPFDFRDGSPNLAFKGDELDNLDIFGLISRYPEIFMAFYHVRTKEMPFKYCQRVHKTCLNIFRYYSRSLYLFKREFKLTAYEVFLEYFTYLDGLTSGGDDVRDFANFIRARIKDKRAIKYLPDIIYIENKLFNLSTGCSNISRLPRKITEFYNAIPRLTDRSDLSQFKFDIFSFYKNILRHPKKHSPSIYLYSYLETGRIKYRKLKRQEAFLVKLINGNRTCREILDAYCEGYAGKKSNYSLTKFILSLIMDGYIYLM